VTRPSNFKKFNLEIKLYFSLFFGLFFLVEDEDGVVGFHHRETKFMLETNLATKIVNFCNKWFYMMRGV
jgi:hypothetical protein